MEKKFFAVGLLYKLLISLIETSFANNEAIIEPVEVPVNKSTSSKKLGYFEQILFKISTLKAPLIPPPSKASILNVFKINFSLYKLFFK